jgi:vacuolar-type H+-ATPase subunit D/Vma8
MKYRHLLVHECTYLNAAKLEELNKAVREVFERLVEVAGYKERFNRLVTESLRAYKGMSVTL